MESAVLSTVFDPRIQSVQFRARRSFGRLQVLDVTNAVRTYASARKSLYNTDYSPLGHLHRQHNPCYAALAEWRLQCHCPDPQCRQTS